MNMDVVIVGFGTVGQGVAEVIVRKAPALHSAFGEKLRLVGVFDSSSYELNGKGLDPREMIVRKEKLGKVGPRLEGRSVPELLADFHYDVMVEVTPTNIRDGEPGLSHMMAALTSGKDVVTANKGPLALKFKELSAAAKKNGARMRFEASVGGATPIINVSRDLLVGEKIHSIRAIVNGTCNFILNRMKEEGLPFEQALREAQELGYAEKDPSYDIDGIDSAAKAAILANAIFGRECTFHDVRRVGIRGVSLEAVSLAAAEKKVIRLVAEVSPTRLEVSPRLVPIGHPLAIGGTLNIFQLMTDLAGEMTVAGKGAGRLETASAVLSDLAALMKENCVAKGREL
ncbi:MAG: homoserine dehydrogenase [Methanomassiliicoccales archaeon]|nr:homoserine dehydrogenase [Methanomassiliicoccales archaeon]